MSLYYCEFLRLCQNPPPSQPQVARVTESLRLHLWVTADVGVRERPSPVVSGMLETAWEPYAPDVNPLYSRGSHVLPHVPYHDFSPASSLRARLLGLVNRTCRGATRAAI